MEGWTTAPALTKGRRLFMPLIGLLLAIVVSLLWYYPVVKAMGETKAAPVAAAKEGEVL